nr:MAG TPA: regulatory protein [Caudoviricetes sp.]
MGLTVGKHHWKVEKQPEWYVRAVKKTIAALPGGYAEAADWLDVTENALFNRLRADGDQIFPLGWAMVLQRAGGTHHIADAVAQSANGVFVSLPEVEEVENADINQRLLEAIEQVGSYSKQIRSAIEDGVVEPHERIVINDELFRAITKLQEHATLVYKIFCAPESNDAHKCAALGDVACRNCGETNA